MLPKTINIHSVFHISLLKLAPLGAPLALYTEIYPLNLNMEYNVKEVLDYQLVRNKTMYLVK